MSPGPSQFKLEATRCTNNGLYVDVRRKTLLRTFVWMIVIDHTLRVRRVEKKAETVREVGVCDQKSSHKFRHYIFD